MTEPPGGRDAPPPAERGSLREVAAVFLKLGVIAFGGPAAHGALMRQELVQRRKWLDDQRFLDLFGAANLIPGPSSTELAIFLGYLRAGWQALILAGVLFIAPAMLMVLAFAWAYVRFGSLPATGWLLYGVKPAIIAIVAQALYGLARTALLRKPNNLLLAAVGLLAFALYLAGLSAIAVLFSGGIAVMLYFLAIEHTTAGIATRSRAAPTRRGLPTAGRSRSPASTSREPGSSRSTAVRSQGTHRSRFRAEAAQSAAGSCARRG